jgi:hypothetical protein
MNHIKAFLIKFISSFILLYLILGVMFNMSLTDVFLVSLVLGAVSYILGDLIILPKTNNMVATMSDIGLAFFVIWLMSEALTVDVNTFGRSLIAAIGVGIFEYFFHRYLSKNVINQQGQRNQINTLQYQTEASEELIIVKPTEKSSNKDGNK